MNQNFDIGDRSHFDGVRRIAPEKLVASFRDALGRNTAVTTGRFEIESDCQVRDLDWNHMDQHHRPLIHHTYQEALRIARGNDFAVSLSKLYIWKFPVLVETTDVRLAPGLFYQTFNLFGIFFVHCVIRAVSQQTPQGERSKSIVEWHIVSHRLARMFHGYISRRLEKLNRVQNDEDEEIRARRAELRGKGYGFSSDEPDFISSNALTLNTRPPRLEGSHRVALADLPQSQLHKVAVGAVDLLIQRRADEGVIVWPGACPHEGSDLSRAKLCGQDIQCHWHGLRFVGTILTPAQHTGSVGALEVRLEGTELVVSQHGSAQGTEADIVSGL